MLVGLLAVAAVALHVEDARGLEAADQRAVVDAVRAAVAARTGQEVVDDREPCRGEDRCFEAIRARTGASDVVYLGLIGAPSRVRVLFERVAADRGSVGKTQADLSRDPATWRAVLEGVALILFPAAATAPPPEPPPPVVVTTAPPLIAHETAEPSSPPVGPWIVLGGAAATGVTAIILGAMAQSARSTLETEPTAPAEQPGLRDRAVNGAWAANILFAVTGAAVAGGVTWLLLSE